MTAAVATALTIPAHSSALDFAFEAVLQRLDNRVVWEYDEDNNNKPLYAARKKLAGLSLHTLAYLISAMEERRANEIRYPTIEMTYWCCWRPMLGSYHSEKFCPRCGAVLEVDGSAVG